MMISLPNCASVFNRAQTSDFRDDIYRDENAVGIGLHLRDVDNHTRSGSPK